MATRVATARTEIEASPQEVWKALTDPALIGKYMFGTKVETDWKPGSPIVWKGEYEGKRYEDKGEILDVQPGKRLELTHYSPLSGDEASATMLALTTGNFAPLTKLAIGGCPLSKSWLPGTMSGLDDRPENYHTVVYELEQQGEATLVSLSQDGNESEEAAERSQSTWETILAGLKETVERR